MCELSIESFEYLTGDDRGDGLVKMKTAVSHRARASIGRMGSSGNQQAKHRLGIGRPEDDRVEWVANMGQRGLEQHGWHWLLAYHNMGSLGKRVGSHQLGICNEQKEFNLFPKNASLPTFQ